MTFSRISMLSLPAAFMSVLLASGSVTLAADKDAKDAKEAKGGGDLPKVDFAKQVRPVLAENCYKCHGPDKHKGDLRLDSPEAIMKGGSDGKAVSKGAPEESPLYLRVVLPTGHDDIMPNEGNPLPREKTDLIGQWIMQGADFGGWKGDAVAGAGGPAPLPQVAAADPAALDKLRQAGARALPLAQGVNLLDVGFSSSGDVADAQLANLTPIAAQVYELNLAGSKVTDAGLAEVGKLTNLRRLHLEKTAVTDAGLANLKGLANLEYLNLYSTAVTDAGLAHLTGLKNLRNLYLWQTKVTAEGAASLKKSLATVTINRGEELVVVPPPAPAAPAAGAIVAAPSGAKPVNLKCPVSGKDAKAEFALLFEGKAVAFCCNMCPEEFKKDPKKFAANIKLDGPGAPAPAPAPAPVAAAGEPGHLDPEGFIRDWLVLAPAALNAGATGPSELDREVVPGEAGLKPKEGDKVTVAGKELTWKKVRANDYFFDVNAIVGTPTPLGAAYAVAYIESPDEKKDMQLLMGSNDEGKVWLNGKEVMKANSGRALAKDSDKAQGLTLNSGTNVLVFKVINESNNWQGCVRLVDKDTKRVSGLKVKTAP
jgi:YHS domain-containing protein